MDIFRRKRRLKNVGALSLHFIVPSLEERFKSHLEELFNSIGLSPAKFNPFIEEVMARAPNPYEGIVNQIFIPKDRVREFLYISYPMGFVNHELNSKLDQAFADFQIDRFSDDCQNDNLQVRILAGKLFDEDVHIFRYSLIPLNEQLTFEQFVSEELDKLYLESKLNTKDTKKRQNSVVWDNQFIMG